MKKIFKSMLLFLVAGTSMLTVSCKDDDDNGLGATTNREFMTMFITDYTRGKGDDYPYNCGVDGRFPNGNTIHLYWYGVNDCAGYQIQMAIQNKVANGVDAWAAIQGTNDLLLDTIVGSDVLDLVVRDLLYSTDYRFAIRALSKQDRNDKKDPSSFAHASNWYGHGNGRQWQEYMGVTTADRYPTPFAVYVDQSQTTESDMHVYINSNLKDIVRGFEDTGNKPFTDNTDAIEKLDAMTKVTIEGLLEIFPKMKEEDQEKLRSYYEHFNIDEYGNFGFKYLTVVPSPSNPNSTVNKKWREYEIQPEDRKRGYVVVDGLTANSVYVIDVVDPLIPVTVDAKYNTCTSRSDGTPGEPILLEHDKLLNQWDRTDTFALAPIYNAAPISPVLLDFISNANYAEGQTFYLEGGKTYYIDGNDITCKGFTLATRPQDVENGLRAKVICGLGSNSNIYSEGNQWEGSYTMFMFGRQPEAGEGGEIYMKKLAFYDIDFDNPTAMNEGDFIAKAGKVAGNYFFNMYSNGMAVTLDSLVIENCTFKRLVRGFIREQGPNYKIFNHILIKNNQFFDCGYYNNKAGGYCWIDGAGTNNQTNFYNDMKVVENTFYDSPFPAFFSEKNEDISWASSVKWNITFSNNTLVNFNTRGEGYVFRLYKVPNGSVFCVENNLLVLTKQAGDQRILEMCGARIQGLMSLADGSAGHVTLNFKNNWSTNDNLTNGSIFSSYGWNSSNGFGGLVNEGQATLDGVLDVEVANISSTDLMVSPCPPHVAMTADEQNMHRADALDGTATTQYNVNLFFKNKNNEIYEKGVGAARWREGQ